MRVICYDGSRKRGWGRFLRLLQITLFSPFTFYIIGTVSGNTIGIFVILLGTGVGVGLGVGLGVGTGVGIVLVTELACDA